MEHKPLSELTSLTGKVALVTGGAMGIGYAIADRLSEAGAAVLIADRDESAADKAADTLSQQGRKVAAVTVDVSDMSQVDAMVAAAVSTFGSLDILVNNAGIYPNIPVMQMTEADVERVLAVNLEGAMFAARSAAQQMIAQGRGGRIINVTSIDALHPSGVGLAIYDASKHGLWGFTKNLALELASHNISVNAIAPGGVSTPGTGAGAPQSAEMASMVSAFLAKIPMRRMADPDEIGTVALFLASDMATYMTGSQVVVDGGALLA